MEFDNTTGGSADGFEEETFSGSTPTIARNDWTFCAIVRWTDPGDDYQRGFSMSSGGKDYLSGGAIPMIEHSNGPNYGTYISGNRAGYNTLTNTSAFFCSICNSSQTKTFVWTVGGSGTPSVQTTNLSAGTNSMSKYKVGGEVDQLSQSYFSGEMGEVMLWNEAHVESDLQKLFDDYIKTDYGF
jgi:hypothetical protein